MEHLRDSPNSKLQVKSSNIFAICYKVYVTNCHVVFVVKYRKDLFLSDDYVAYVKVILQEIERRYILKSITAREMFQHFPGIKEELWDGEFWSDGGYIGTVGEGPNAEIIRKYVKNQGRQGDQSRLIDFTTQWLK